MLRSHEHEMTRRSYDQEKLITKAFSVNHNDRQPITITLRLITNQPECIDMKRSIPDTNRQNRAQKSIAASRNRNKQYANMQLAKAPKMAQEDFF